METPSQIARITAPRTCLIEDITYSDPGDAVLTANELSLISPGTELAMFCGTHQELANPDFPWAKYPFVPGYAAVGKVLASNRLSPGTRIAHAGKHGPHSLTDSERCYPISNSAPAERLVFQRLVQIAMTAPYVAPPRPSDTVIVIGAGMIGNLAAQIYRELSAARVLCSEKIPFRRDMAEACGLELLPDAPDLATALNHARIPPPAIIVDAVATADTINASLDALADGGALVLLGSPRQPVTIDVYRKIHFKCVRLLGAHENARSLDLRRHDSPQILRWLENNRILTQPLITDHIHLSDLPRMYDELSRHPDQHLGVLIHY